MLRGSLYKEYEGSALRRIPAIICLFGVLDLGVWLLEPSGYLGCGVLLD